MNRRYPKALRIVTLLALAVAVLTVKVWTINTGAAVQTPASAAATSQDQKTFDQDAALAELRKRIAGQENKPAEEVFKNIQLLKGMPAGRLLAVMRIGYSRSLGVTCTHCHVANEWEKDDKPAKQIARDMALMNKSINNDLLKKIKNLKSESPVVNCTTCHRGQVKPALDLP
jgi:hypothetical protein